MGWHDWEGQLNDRERHQLASTRAAFEPRDEIELPFQDFEGLTEGEEADPLSRAAAKLKAELGTYRSLVEGTAGI